MMYVVYGYEYESTWMISVHKTQAGAEKEARRLNKDEDEGFYYSVKELPYYEDD